jgi:hypothetical protein
LTRETILECPTLSSLFLKGWVLLGFGFSRADVCFILHHHAAGFHDPNAHC